MVKNNDRRFGILSWSPYSQPKESEEEKENSRKQPKRTESDSLLNPPKMTRFGSDSKLPKPEEGREKTQEDRPKSGHVRFQGQEKNENCASGQMENKFKTPATLRKQESQDKRASPHDKSVSVNGTDYTVSTSIRLIVYYSLKINRVKNCWGSNFRHFSC